MFINHQWQKARHEKTRQIKDPATQEVIATVQEGSEEDALLAIEAASHALSNKEWKNVSREKRKDILLAIAQLTLEHKEKLSELESLNTGKPLDQSQSDMDDVAAVFSYYASLIGKETDEKLTSPYPHTDSLLSRVPVGVCAQILPWNYPLLQASWKIAPALAAGCTMILKPSELTPLSLLEMTKLMADLLPKGVLNVVTGTGDNLGAVLSSHPLVDMVSFTGSFVTGQKILQAASQTIKKVSLELGGKNPHIIFRDADLELSVDYAMNAVFFHAGQICSAGTRLLIDEELHDLFIEKLLLKMKKIKLGSPFSKSSEMGPLISQEQRDKIKTYIQSALDEGARLLTGGLCPKEKDLEKGFFFLPTLLINCHEHMQIIKKELFAPVITVETFTTSEEAIKLANGTNERLSAGFWTKDPQRKKEVAQALDFGTIWINDYNVYFPEAPWGGIKHSGLGRELGKVGYEEYTELKHIFQNNKPQALHYFGRLK